MSFSLFEGDLKLYQKENGTCELYPVDATSKVALDNGLENYYYISLLSHRRNDENKDGFKSKEGWWGDEFTPQYTLGCMWYARTGDPLTPQLLTTLKQDAKQALSWMEEEGLVDEHVIEVTLTENKEYVQVLIQPRKFGLDPRTFIFYYNWKNQILWSA